MELSIIDIVGYGNSKTEKLCSNRKNAQKVLGELVTDKLYATLNFIDNAKTLNDVACIPSFHLHQLEPKHRQHFAIDLGRKIGYRIVVIPDPPLNEEENKLDFNSKCECVKCVLLLEVTNHYE